MEKTKKRKGLSGSTLKCIAAFAMLIDHAAYVLIYQSLETNYAEFLTNPSAGPVEFQNGYFAYTIMRMIGRIAFPIFCYVLVEGFLHTKNLNKYLLRLAIFALVSEIPFDLAIYQTPFHFGHQNVIFTMFIGLASIAGMRYLGFDDKEKQIYIWQRLLPMVPFLVGFALASVLCTDYSGMGVALIVILYYFKTSKTAQILFGCLLCASNPTALFGFIPVHFYNGTKGRDLKYFFYIFYPAHLLVLYLLGLFF